MVDEESAFALLQQWFVFLFMPGIAKRIAICEFEEEAVARFAEAPAQPNDGDEKVVAVVVGAGADVPAVVAVEDFVASSGEQHSRAGLRKEDGVRFRPLQGVEAVAKGAVAYAYGIWTMVHLRCTAHGGFERVASM